MQLCSIGVAHERAGLLSRWIPRWLESRRAILGDDATTEEMVEQLRGIPAEYVLATAHDTERAAIVLQQGAAQRLDSDSRRKLIRAVNRVENAERRYRIANARVDRFKSGASVRSLIAHEEQEAQRAQKRAADEIDRTTPRVRPTTVLLAEFVLLVAEFAFYYDVFSKSQQDDAPLVLRVLTGVMALLVPVVGIMSARFFAGAVHHLRAPRHDGESPKAPWLYVSAAVILLAITCYTTVRLVEWRYRAEDASAFGTAEHPPGTIMAVVFAVFILLDALTRAFMFDPGESTAIGRRWKGRSTRSVDWWLLRLEAAALARWQKKWFKAMALVEKLKNDADQEMLSATVAILLNRGRTGRPPSKLNGIPEEPVRNGHQVLLNGQGPVGVLRSTGTPDAQLDADDAHVFLPQRLIRLTIARLEVIRPPEDPKQERRNHDEDLSRAAMPHNMAYLQKVTVDPTNGSQAPHGLQTVIDESATSTV